LYCFPPVSNIANDINFLLLKLKQYNLKDPQVKAIEPKNYPLNLEVF